MKTQIPFHPLSEQWKQLHQEVWKAIDSVGQKGQWILGPRVQAFESALAQRWQRSFAVACGSGLDAIEIALRCSGVGPGTPLLTTPLSAFATTLAALHIGAVPVFIDTDESGLMDLNICERILAERSDIRFLLPVHLYGHCLDLEQLERLSSRYSLTIIEDCAQSIGATFGKRLAGTVGKAAAVSFYPTKNLGCLGDGGALVTSDAAVAERARCLRDYGQSAKYLHTDYGLNSRLDELQAAVLNDVFLPHLDAWTLRRLQIANRYLQGLSHPQLSVARPPKVEHSAWHLFPLLVHGDRTAFQRYLADQGVQTAIHYPRLITDQPVLAGWRSQIQGPLTRAAWIAEHEVSLPLHPWLSDQDIEFIVSVCNAWKP